MRGRGLLDSLRKFGLPSIFVLGVGAADLPADASEYVKWREHQRDWHAGCVNNGRSCITTIDYRHHQEPTQLLEAIEQCTDSELCRAALSGLMTAAGVPPAVAGILSQAGAYVLKSARREGQSMHSEILVPRGHVLCTVRWRVYSATGHAALGFGVRKNGITIYSFAQKRPIGGGGQWVKAMVEVRSVDRRDVAAARRAERCMPAARYGRGIPVWHDGAVQESGNAQSARFVD